MVQGKVVIGSMGVVLLFASSPAVAEYLCGPQWLDNLPPINGEVFCATTWDADGDGPNPPLLVLGGGFSMAGGVAANNIAAFDGTQFYPLGSGTNEIVWTLAIHNGELVAGGRFTTADGGAANHVARWNGSSWSPMSGGLGGFVYALAVYNGELYAGGTFIVSGTQSIARWDGSNWAPVAGGMAYAECPADWCGTSVQALTVYNNELVAGGYFTAAGGITARYVARWNGSQWNSLGGGFNNTVQALAVRNGEIYAGGHFTLAYWNSVSANHVAVSSGGAWRSLGSGIDGAVYALSAHGSGVIAAGWFSQSGSVPANRIARWDGTAWTSLGSGLNGLVRGLHVFEDDLIAVGGFTTAGDVDSQHWGRWRDPPPPQITRQPIGLSLVVGQNARFSVAGSGVVPLQYQWRKNGIPIEEIGRFSGTQTPELTIASVEKNDAGSYDVVLTDCKSSISSSAYLSVACPLAITTQPVPQAVNVGDAAILSVEITGTTGTPRFEWWKASVRVQDDGFHIFGASSATLLISPVGTRDGGSYNVVVRDDCGAVGSAWATLAVSCPATVMADFDRDCDVDAADLATFLSCASGPNVPPLRCPRWQNDKNRAVADFDADGDVDQTDFGVLQRCISGANTPPEPQCAG